MGELYDRIASLCSNKGIRPGKMCNDLGISRGSIGDLKKGRREGISIKTATKIADYFGVTTDYLLTGDETKKAPTQDGERGIDEQNLKVAFFRGADPTLTKEDMDAMWEDARAFRDFIVAKRKREKEKNGG